MATYWVSPTGSNSNPGSQALPWLTIGFGVLTMAGGDTLMVRSGTYNTGSANAISNPKSGIPTQYTTIKWDGVGTKPLVRGATTTNSPSGRLVAAVRSATYTAAYIEINGFEAENMGQVISLVDNVDGIPHHWRIINNYLHHSHAMAIQTPAETTGNVDIGHYIAGNEFAYMGFWRPGYVPGENIIYNPGTNSIVENNVSHDCTNGFGIWKILSVGTPLVKNVTIRNNIFYNMGRLDINTWAQGANSASAIYVSIAGGGHKIYNNIIYNCGYPGNVPGPQQATLTVIKVGNQATAATSVLIANNTIYNLLGTTSRDSAIIASTSTPLIRNNIVYQTLLSGIDGGTQANNLTSNPSFVNAGAANFHLQAGSAAINQGLNLSANFTTDFDGVTRPASGAWEVGAFEFVATDTTPPAAPTGITVS